MANEDSSAFQDAMPFNHCWGCGADNENGLQLKSHWQGERAVAAWQPQAQYMAGPEHVLNGGIISTLLDCHGVCTAVADGYRQEGRAVGEGEIIWYVTGSLSVSFLKPTPIDAPVHLEAIVERREGRKTWLQLLLSSQGEARARGELLAIRVSPEWMERAL